ncbi:ribonuclease Z [archaeon]|nr:ribonuclease Z [archaeon]
MKAHLVFLGTSSGTHSPERNHPSLYVEFGGKHLLFDCGEGTQRQMMRAGVSIYKLDAVFISHLHADHWLGIGGLVQTASFWGRREPLPVYGPRGIRRITDFFALEEDALQTRVHALRKGVVYDGGSFIVRAFPLLHSAPCYGFVLEEKAGAKLDKQKLRRYGLFNSPLCRALKEKGKVKVGGRIVTLAQVASWRAGFKMAYVTDSRPCAAIARNCKGADIMVCESTFGEDHRKEAHAYGHMTAKDAASLAKKAGAHRLFLTHFSPRYKDVSVLEKEAQRVFPRAKAASDFMEAKV